MRTTVLLKDDLVVKARKLSGEKSLSGLLNACLSDWIAHHGRKQLETRLAAEYRDGAAEARTAVRDFAAVDKARLASMVRGSVVWAAPIRWPAVVAQRS